MQDDAAMLWDIDLPAFAGVIHGHAMITGFCTGDGFPFQCLDILCSALLTLPALENVLFEHDDGQGPEEAQSLESMIKLLQTPTLRKVYFESIVFTNTLSQAVAKALTERSEITDLRFFDYSFPEGGGAVIASALKTNTTLQRLYFYKGDDEVFYDVLAESFLSNSTLQNLSFDGSSSCSWLSPLFLSQRVNNGLKKLNVAGIDLTDEKVSTVMRLGLGKDSTLEILDISTIMGHSDTCLCGEAFSFLRTNTALKVLDMDLKQNITKSHANAIRMKGSGHVARK
jgi:hypothetical protein